MVYYKQNMHPGGVGVIIAQSYDNEVSYNQISNTSYTGISVGWSWGYASATSGRNLILGNSLFNIGQGMLADMGGIYTVGISPGTVTYRLNQCCKRSCRT